MRSKIEMFLAGEAPTTRELKDEARYAKGNVIEEILWRGVLTREKENIKNAFQEHYTELFSSTVPKLNDFKRDFLSHMTRLDEYLKKDLERPISLSEIERAMADLKGPKAPGPGGLGADFDKKFSDIVAPFLFMVFTEAYESKVLPFSCARTDTVLIPKSEDRVKLQSVSGYRPITLANMVYKILMKILAERLQSVITRVVGPHQTCGIKGRTILTNIHVARSVLQCCDMLC